MSSKRRKVLNGLGSGDEIFGGGFGEKQLKQGDAIVITLLLGGSLFIGYPLFGIIMFGNIFHPFGFTAVLMGFYLSYKVMKETPPDKTALEYLKDWNHRRTQADLFTRFGDSGENSTESTQVGEPDRVGNLITRTDNTVVATTRVKARSMSAASSNDWERTADNFGSFCNNQTAGFEISCRGWQISADEIIGDIDSRLQDADVAENEKLRAAVRSHDTELREEIKNRGSTNRKYRASIEVGVNDVERDLGRTEKWNQIVVIGHIARFFQWVGLFHTEDKQALRERQKRSLSSRIRSLRRGIDSIHPEMETMEGYTDEWLDDIEAFWSGWRGVQERNGRRQHDIPVVIAPDTFEADELNGETGDNGEEI